MFQLVLYLGHTLFQTHTESNIIHIYTHTCAMVKPWYVGYSHPSNTWYTIYINGMLASGNLLPFAMDETTINKQWGYNWIMKVDWSLVGPDAFWYTLSSIWGLTCGKLAIPYWLVELCKILLTCSLDGCIDKQKRHLTPQTTSLYIYIYIQHYIQYVLLQFWGFSTAIFKQHLKNFIKSYWELVIAGSFSIFSSLTSGSLGQSLSPVNTDTGTQDQVVLQNLWLAPGFGVCARKGLSEIRNIGVSMNGESPIAGWFIREKPSINGW